VLPLPWVRLGLVYLLDYGATYGAGTAAHSAMFYFTGEHEI